MADHQKKYYQYRSADGKETRIWDEDEMRQYEPYVRSQKGATLDEVNSFRLTYPEGNTEEISVDKYVKNRDLLNSDEYADVGIEGLWIGAQQPSGPVGPTAAPPTAKKDPFKPTMEREGAMYAAPSAPLHESSSVPVPEKREVTPEQRSDIRAKVALGEKVLQRPGKPRETPLPGSSKVAFSDGYEYQLTTRNGDRIRVMLYPNADGVVDNGDGTVNVVVNRAEVDGEPVVSQMSKVEFQQMYDRTLGSETKDAEKMRGNATRDQVRLLSEDIDARLNDLAGTASDRFSDMVGKESVLERLNRIMPLTSGGPGPMSMPATADPFNTLSQGEKDDYQALQAAKRSVRDASRIIEEADHNAQEGSFDKWLESSFVGGAARGFGQKFFDIDTWDMGVSDVKDGAALITALDAFDKGEPLTEAQQMLLDAKAVELATNAYFGSYVGRGYKAGSVTAESIPFMIEMCINPASSIGNAATNKMARYAIKRFGKQAAKKGIHRVLRGAGRIGADLAGATLMAGTTGLPGVAGETMERMAGLNEASVGYDNEGRSVFTGIRDGEDPATAFAKSFGSRVIENYSEMFGEYFAPIIGGAGKVARGGLEKIHLGKVVDFLDNVNGSDLAKMVGDFEKHARWNGSIGEYAEEVAGGVMNALLVGDQTLDADPETGVFNLDNNIDTFLGVGLMGGAFGAIKTAGYRTPKYRTKKELDRMDSYGKATFRNQKDWTDFTTQLAQDPNAALHDVLVGDHTQAERQAALQYAKASMEYQGALATEEKRDVSPEQRDAETSFDNGYSLTEPQEMHDSKVALQARRAALKDAFGEEDINLDELNIEQGDEGWTPEQKAIAMDYINAKATYEGMIQRVKDDIGSQTDEAFAEIDRNTNSDMDSLIPVTMADGRQGYIVRGNIVLGEDGRIDKSQSDKAIIVRDAETGDAEWSTPALVIETAGILDPQAEKEAAAARIGEQVAQAEADKIDGTMQFSEGESRQVVTPDGQLAQMTVTPNDKGVVENEDGTVNVAISSPDGSTRMETMTREEIGQAVDAADAVRLAEYDASRVAKDQEQVARDEEAIAPYAAIPRGADVRVHWETGDATYRFEGARLDEDGQVVFDAVDPENEEAGAIEIPASEVTNMKDLLGVQSEPADSEMETVEETPAQTPAVPVSESGIKQYQQAPVEATYQDIYTDPAFETPEEAAGFVDGKIRRTEAALAEAEKALAAIHPEDFDVPADYKAARDAARLPVEAARQALDYWNAVRTYAELQKAPTAEQAPEAEPAPAAEPVLAENAGPTSEEMKRKMNLRKAVEAKRRKGNYSAELDEIEKDGQVGSFKDFIRRTLLRGKTKLLWSDSKDGVQKGLGSHLNKGRGEMNQRVWLLRNEDGKYPEQLADELLEAYADELGVDPDNISGGNATFALDALLDILRSEPTPSMMFESVKAEHESSGGDDRNDQAAYDEMMRELADEARRSGMSLDDLLDYYDLHFNDRAREFSENYDEINAIFAEDQSNEYGQQIREPEEVHGRVPGEEGIRGGREGGDALGGEATEAPGRDSLRDIRGEDVGGEGNTGQARFESVSDAPLAEGESASGESREIEDLPEASGENPVVQAIEEAAAQVDTNPTDAQKEAGNYRKGHVTVDGYDISIENPKGSVRSGRDSSGKEWSVTMNNNYGYIRRTEGVDGDHIDVFLSNDPTEGKVFVVDQVKPDGSFDEHKVMYGFNSAEEAKAAYLANYSPGWTGLGAISEVSKEEFRKWIDSSHRKTKPFAEYRTVDKDGVQRGGIDLDREAAEAVAFATGRTAEDVAAEREEARRAPLRDRIHEWERQVGVKANIIESLDGVKNAAARRAILNGDTVSGWFEKKSGEVYIYLPGTADVAEVDKTYMHEVVAHKGVRELLGEERFNRLMDSVWNDVMSEKDRKDWTDYVRPDMPGRSEEDIQRAAADEYVASLAENLSTEDNRSAWDKFVARVREILRDMGFDIKKEDIQDILRESYENLRKGAKSGPRTEESTPARPGTRNAAKEAKIEDFGEKIGGARKDQARERIRDSFKLSAKDLVELKDPDKILSRKQIAKYLAEGQMTNADAQTLLAANMAVRSASGMDAYKTALMMKYRSLASAWEKGEDLSFDITNADIDYVFSQYSERIQQMPNIRDRIRKDFEHHLKDYADYKRTYEALDYPNTARQIKSAYIREGRVDGKFWVVAGANAYRGWPFATFEQAVAKIQSVYPEVANVEKEAKKAKDSGDEKTGHLKVVKDEYGYYRVKSNLIPGQILLSKRFYTRKDAEAYLNDNAEALVEKETKMSYALMGSNIGMVQREGRDYRGGKDVTEKMFMDTFAPRGVEFGNWVPQAERQEYLNKTYDAIMDFCEVVGISPKAFFLGGRLAVAFGARGKGGALAHYEPVKEVINLTRMKGAGSLAHEWFHAIDNQLAKQKTGNTSDMATDTKNVVREEVATAFREFVTAMNALDYSRRSRRAGEYWGEVWERAARLFADYTYNELGGKGIVSPLLSRKPDEVDEQAEDFILSVWPYATKQENAAMKPYFDRLFAAIQEEEGTGVLFRKSGADRKKAQLDIIQASNPMTDDYHTGIRSEKDILTLPEAVEAAREAAAAGGWNELAAYPDITNRMLENAVKSGTITVFSSYPIENGVFVTPSRMQARDYAGGREVFSKTVPIDDVAWISTDEGQFARVEDTRFVEETPRGPLNPDIRFRKANQNQLGLVSNAEAALDRIKMEKATPEQWVKMLEKEGGLKAGEDKWIGLSDWLKSQKKKSVTKEEIADYIAEHRIQIEEVKYSGGLRDEIKDTIGRGRALPELQEEIDELKESDDYQIIGDSWLRDEFLRDEMKERYGDDFEIGYDIFDGIVSYNVDEFSDMEFRDNYDGPTRPINDIRLQYTTDGLENNREIALTVPTIDPWKENDELHFGDAGKGRAIAWIRFGETTTRTPASKEEIEAYENSQPKAEEWKPFINARGNTVYFPKGNRMSHDFVVERDGRFTVYLNEIPLNTEETLQAAVKSLNHTKSSYAPNELKSRRILVIDEIQSNRHQQGREKGYASKEPENKAYQVLKDADKEWHDIVKEVFGGEWKDAIDDDGVKQSYLEQVPAVDVARILDAQYKRTQAGFDYENARDERVMKEEAEGLPPAAPFEKNWHELAMKRMLRLAAEEGYDKIAWTTGDQQADRYDIGNYVSSIDRTEADEGERSFGLYLGDSDHSTEVVVDEDGKVIRAEGHLSQAIGKPLEELVGKDIAAKMMRMEEYDVIEDVDLKMGNDGMRGFYDDILPRFMNKYGKKWGVKVQDIELPDLGNTGLTMHSVDVTPEMKESVLEGQTMFRKSPSANSEAAIAGSLYDRYENQDGLDYPWMSEKELIDRIEEELPHGVNTRNIFAKIDEYRRLDQEDFDEGRRDFSGSDRDSVFEEILSGLERLAEDDGATRFRKVPLNRETIEEMESIKAVAFTTGRLGLAPNGKPSRLSEENWALVRTNAFKRWFGDWEFAARLVRFVNASEKHPFNLVQKEKDAVNEIVDYATKNGIAKTLSDEETGGKGIIDISRNSISKMAGDAYKYGDDAKRDIHLNALLKLHDIIRESVLGEAHASQNKGKDGARRPENGTNADLTILRYYGAINVNGIPYRTKTTVRRTESSGKQKAYTYEITEIELLDGISVVDESNNPASNNSITVANLLKGVKKYNSSEEILDFSKVIDANGEPMVLFHQTEGDITQFDPRHPGAGTSDYMTPFGIFLKPTPNDIGLRGKLQIPLFASIRNPLVFESRTDLVRWLEENVPGYKAGADRLKDIDWEYGRKNDKAWEVDEKVFLDLREQRINKEITEEEFRRRFDEYQSESQKVLDEWSEASRELAVQMKDMIGTYLRGSGYDGVHIRKDAGSFGRVVETYIALEPSQVKSAEDNTGGFDPGNDDIRFSKKSEKEPAGQLAAQNEQAPITDSRAKIRDNSQSRKTIPPLRRPAPAPEMAPAALVRKVEGGGLRAILGDERTKEFYESVYQVATPEEAQALAEKANEPGYDLFRAVKEYLADLAEKGFESDDTGMLRNAAFRLSLQIDSEGNIGDNVLQYILWRNGRRYNRNDQVAEAANVNMKVRLKVGEYAGETLADKTEKGMSAVNEETKEARIKLAKEKQAAVKKMPKTSADLLQKVTKAMSAQREYDRATVDSITALAKTLINEGGIDSVSAREMGRLMSIVSKATGKATLQRSADQLVDFMARHILKTETDALIKMTKVKASKEKQPGVDVQDKLDPEGQLIVKALKYGMTLPLDAIDSRMTELQDKREKGRLAKMEADAEIAGLSLAYEYVEKVTGAEQEEERMKQAIKDARFEKQMTPTAYREYVSSMEDAILENVVKRIQALRDIRARLADVIAASGERATLWNEKEQQRADEIRHDANRDLEGMPAEEQGHDMSLWDRIKGSKLLQFFAMPLGTFDNMLRFLGRKSPDGRGYLFQRFIAMWNLATSEAWAGLQESYSILDAKVKEIFGDKVERWSDLYSIEHNLDQSVKHTQKFWDGTKMVEKELSSGNLLYIYMVDKMVDGKMKLRRMGITEEDVERIKQELDPRFIQLADWIQEDFLVGRRLKYDEVHRRVFGSSMEAIDNYVPLRVLANARERKEEVGGIPEGQQMPSKFTGSIINRRRNSLALDLKTDAFSVVVEHVQEMEDWAAWVEFRRDLGTLLSYRHFRNQLENMSTVYGSGKGDDSLFENFKKVCEIAAGVYKREGSRADRFTTNFLRGVSTAKVSFRVFTAFKQVLSLPAFFADARLDLLAKSMITPGRSWKWCMENLPVFQKRWKSRQAGNEKLQDSDMDYAVWRKNWVQTAARWGMTPNAFVDALTVSVGAYAVYQTRLQQYLKDGYTQEKAEEKAKLDATVSFNESQQSSEGAFLSVMQSDRTVVNNSLSVFRNSSFGYGRRYFGGWRTVGRMIQRGYRQEAVEFMEKQFVEDGLDQDLARNAAERAYRRAFGHALADMAVFGFGVQFAWNISKDVVYILLGGGGDDDKWWNGKKKDAILDSAAHSLFFGPVEGLPLGSIISEMANMIRRGESFRNYSPSLLPMFSDIEQIIKTFENDEIAGAIDVVNLLVQSTIGANPENITDTFVALYDACNGDLGLAKESLIAAMRILQVPQSQVDQFLLDELDLTGEEYDDEKLPEIAERYARYQIRKGAPILHYLYSDRMRRKLENKYINRFMDKAKEARKVRGSGFDKEFLTYLDEDYKETKAELQELKDNAAIDPEGYAAALDEFYSSPEFAQYKLADLIEKTRKGIEKAEKGSRNRTELIKNLNDYKKEFLDSQAALKDKQNK